MVVVNKCGDMCDRDSHMVTEKAQREQEGSASLICTQLIFTELVPQRGLLTSFQQTAMRAVSTHDSLWDRPPEVAGVLGTVLQAGRPGIPHRDNTHKTPKKQKEPPRNTAAGLQVGAVNQDDSRRF